MKNAYAVALGRRGGQARARSLSPERVRAIAGAAARKRWGDKLPLLGVVFELADFYGESMGTPTSMRADLEALVVVLKDHPYAVIGGIAIQPRRKDPRTTKDIDVAIPSWEQIPRDALLAAGFKHKKRHLYSDNWKAPGGTMVQFSCDKGFAAVVSRRVIARDAQTSFWSATVGDLMVMKAEAALEPRRRWTKKLTDVQDVVDLVGGHKAAYDALPEAGKAKVDKVLAFGDVFKELK